MCVWRGVTRCVCGGGNKVCVCGGGNKVCLCGVGGGGGGGGGKNAYTILTQT